MNEEEKRKLLVDAMSRLAHMIHKDYSAGPDGFKVYKTDVGKMMGKAIEETLKPREPLPKDSPKF